MNKKVLQEGLLFAAIYMLLIIITVIVPASEILTVFLLPIPIIVYTVRNGNISACLFVLFLLVVSLFYMMILSFPLTLLAGLGGLFIGMAINQKLSAYEILARGTAGFVLGMLMIFIFVQLVFGINIINELNQTMEQSINTTQELMNSFGIQQFTPEELDQIREEIMVVVDLLPVIFVVMALFLAFITEWLSFKVLNKLEKTKLYFPPFRNFVLPKILVWVYLFTIIFSSFDYETNSMMYQVSINVSQLTGILIALQGISFIFYWTYMKKASIAIPIIVTVFTVLFLPIGLYLARILGIIDLGFSLRKKLKAK
ncbi:YybS family protein [Aquibacillus kalidii]|uniref:YybS family protein n=1 Tax=Aquibacillus kalidii TaxID=2762597 RepID=UPI001647FF20|nr:DUF2232 domain-containing protein [Aquibacillus kalidii]